MNEIASNHEMNLIRLERQGFVFNERADRRMVHHA